MTYASLDMIYNEIKSLHKDLEIVKQALVSEEKISAKESAELKQIFKEMRAGKRKNFNEIFKQ